MRISDWSSDVCSSDLIAGRQSFEKIPRPDVIPAGFKRHQRELVGLLHHRIIDRLVATFLPGLAVQRDRVAFTLGLLQRLQRANVGFRRSEEHTSELQSLMRISYAVFCLNKKK